mgnify:CR=1 FL=1
MYTSAEYLKLMFQRKISESVCDKLFKKDIFVNNRFDENMTNEDFLFMSNVLLQDFSISIVEYAGYNYLQHEGSISKDKCGKSLICSVYNAEKVKHLVEQKKPELISYAGSYLIYQARSAQIQVNMRCFYDYLLIENMYFVQKQVYS